MAARCPYCKRPIMTDMAVTEMTGRQMRIYQAVCSSGHKGIEIKDLIAAMFGGRTPPRSAYGMLRVQIHAINQTIKNYEQKVTADRRGRYQLKERIHGTTTEEITEKANP